MGILATGLLFYGFYQDGLHVADPAWFARCRGEDVVVVGRMVKSRRDGLFSAGGLNGWVMYNDPTVRPEDRWIDGRSRDYQVRAYLEDLPFDSYHAYLSQPGGQSLLFSALDRCLPLAGEAKLQWFHGLAALLSAVTLTLLVLWFLREFGWCVALFALATMVSSQWLVVLGSSLWWSIWALYLPMIGAMYFLEKDRRSVQPRVWECGLLVFALVFLKCLINGWEYGTATLLMTMVPFVYEGVRGGRPLRTSGKRFLVAGLAAVLAVAVSLTLLCIQIAAVKGSVRDGVRHVIYSFQKRTYADPKEFPGPFRASLAAPAVPVVRKYLEGSFVDLERPHKQPRNGSGGPRKVTYQFLVALFLVASVVVCLQKRRWAAANRWRGSLALVASTWFSILGPLSWFVIFKAHSFVHLHLNFIAWQMPFTIFGFAVCGLALRSAFLRAARPVNSPSP